MKCLLCGGDLQAVALGPDTAPWVCQHCSRGWWQSELDAARLFRPEFNDFGVQTSWRISATVHDEYAQAVGRGSSARPDTLPLLPDIVLDNIAVNSSLSRPFQAQVLAEQKRRKAKP